MGKFIKYLNESIEMNNPQLDIDIINCLLEGLTFANQIHVYHLLTKSYAEHVSLGEFYDSLRSLIDGISEKSIGLGLEQIDIQKISTLKFSYERELLMSELNSYKVDINELLDKTKSNNTIGINDDFIDIVKSIDTLLYKLQLS